MINPIKELKGKQLSPRAGKGKPEPIREAKKEAPVVLEEKELGLIYFKPEFDKLLC